MSLAGRDILSYHSQKVFQPTSKLNETNFHFIRNIVLSQQHFTANSIKNR